MPQLGLIFRVLVASPSDCVQERKIIPEVIAAWNAVHSLSAGAVLEPVMWETHSRPAMGNRPQELLNKQLVQNCDLLVGAFWTRLGTPTGKADSGTVEEIEEFRSASRPVLLYFSSAPVVPESLEREQYEALLKYRDELQQDGLYSRYETHADFRDQFQRHLASTMIDLLKDAKPGAPVVGGEGSKPDPLEEQRRTVQEFRAQFEGFLRRLRAEWSAERDSDPINIDEGKFILDRAAGELIHFRSMITHDGSDLSSTLDDALKRIKALGRHELYMDGGRSFKEFWSLGDGVLEDLGRVPAIINEVLETPDKEGQTEP